MTVNECCNIKQILKIMNAAWEILVEGLSNLTCPTGTYIAALAVGATGATDATSATDATAAHLVCLK